MLSSEQLRRFGEDGYLVVPSVVAEHLLAAVDDEIDALVAADPPPDGTVGKHFWFLAPGRLPASDVALRDSGALEDIAGELVAPHALDHGLDHIQIALNYPPGAHRPGGPHLDGHRPEQHRPHSFTMLAAIYLVDELEPQAGNLWVWPGSHLDHQRLFQERGARALLAVGGHSTMLDPPPPLREQVPVMARRGDLLLAHYLLGVHAGISEVFGATGPGSWMPDGRPSAQEHWWYCRAGGRPSGAARRLQTRQ